MFKFLFSKKSDKPEPLKNPTKLELRPNGREKMRITRGGAFINWTYPDQDPSIPAGMRKGTFLEQYDGNFSTESNS